MHVAAAGHGALAGDADDVLLVGGFQRLVDAAAGRVVDADDGGARLGLAVEDLPLGLHVAVEPAVTIEVVRRAVHQHRSEEHTSELQSLMRISYAVSCLQKKK